MDVSVSEKSKNRQIWGVITASSMGTLIEWYDFYIFGSMAIVLSSKFFPETNPTAAFLSTLATFAAGFIVRPFGALFFGRLGDLIGRKHTFMITLLIMGGATFAIGCIPSYETIGIFSTLLVLIMRLLQGLALGGEYGGAATYVAEYSQPGRRGYWTSWIQTTATIGLFLSLIVILITKTSLSAEEFDSWGWRVPFWVSILMVGVSYIIRKNMKESPLFAKAKKEGKTSKNPLKESFGNRYNFKFVLLALFGAAMGQGVVWYTGQFYAMSYLQKVMNVNTVQVDTLMVTALFLGTPFFVFFGWLSDKIGRKTVMMAGMIVAICAYRPIYEKMYQTVNLENKTELTDKSIVREEVKSDYAHEGETLNIKTTEKIYSDGTRYNIIESTGSLKIKNATSEKERTAATKITESITITDHDKWILTALVWIQVIFVTMVYAPIAAFLVEMFPTKIRYTSMSLPYHIGNGIFGGLLPAVATYLVTYSKLSNKADWYLEGLWYPIIITGICFVIGMVYLKNKNNISND
ncbi:MAG: MHS family MFS transporter [Flavobacteriaceae bacterium]|nr:MHS family MFS transporter [Flavobacteriaceae bacterium]